MIADHFSKAIRELIGVAPLRQFAFKIVSDRESAGNVDVRHALAARSQIRMDTKCVCWVSGVRKALVGRNRLAGILYQRGILRMQKCALALTEKCEPRLVNRGRSNGPGVADVQLLNSLVCQIAKTGHCRAASLKFRKRLSQIVLCEVIVSCQVLVLCQLMVDLDRELVAALMLQRSRLKNGVTDVRVRNATQEVQRCLVHALRWNHIAWENSRVRHNLLRRGARQRRRQRNIQTTTAIQGLRKKIGRNAALQRSRTEVSRSL